MRPLSGFLLAKEAYFKHDVTHKKATVFSASIWFPKNIVIFFNYRCTYSADSKVSTCELLNFIAEDLFITILKRDAKQPANQEFENSFSALFPPDVKLVKLFNSFFFLFQTNVIANTSPSTEQDKITECVSESVCEWTVLIFK